MWAGPGLRRALRHTSEDGEGERGTGPGGGREQKGPWPAPAWLRICCGVDERIAGLSCRGADPAPVPRSEGRGAKSIGAGSRCVAPQKAKKVACSCNTSSMHQGVIPRRNEVSSEAELCLAEDASLFCGNHQRLLYVNNCTGAIRGMTKCSSLKIIFD